MPIPALRQLLRPRTLATAIGAFAVFAVAVYLVKPGVYRRLGIISRYDPDETNTAEFTALKTASFAPNVPPPSAGGLWPHWRGPARDGHAPPGPLRTDWEKQPPTQLWSVPLGGGFSSFAVAGGRAYTMDRQGDTERAVCLDAATGATVWTHSWPADYAGLDFGSGPRTSPAVADGKVYAIGVGGLFQCIEDGKVRWQHDLLAEFEAVRPDYGFAASPLIEGDLVIVQPGGKTGTLAAYDRVTGELKWKAGSDQWAYSSPVAATVGGVRQIIAAANDVVLGVRADTGQLLWRHPWVVKYRNIATPVVVGEYVFLSAAYDKGCMLLRLRSDGGTVKPEQVYFRSNRVMRNHYSTSVHKDGFVYGFDSVLGMRCVDLRKGEAVEDWEGRDADNKALDKGTLILAGDKLVGLTTTGTVFLAEADPTEFKFRGKLKDVLSGGECWAVPVLVDGRLYVRDGEKAVCLDVK